MLKKYVVRLAIIVPFCLLFIFLITPCSQVATILIDRAFQLPIATASPDEAVNRAQDILNLMNVVVAIFGIVLTTVTVGVGVLGYFGFTTLKDMRESQDAINALRKDMLLTQEDLDAKTQAVSALLNRAQSLDVAASKVQNIEKEIQHVEKIRAEVEARIVTSYLTMGSQLLREESVTEALDYLEKARELKPHDAQINYQLGNAYSYASKYDQAIHCFQAAIEADPESAKAYKDLGLCYRRRARIQTDHVTQLEDYAHAVKALLKAIGLHADYWEAYGTLGGLYRRLGALEKAAEFYQQAYEVDTSASYGIGNLACIHLRLLRVDEARHDFEVTKQLAAQRIASSQSGDIDYYDYYDLGMAQYILGCLDDDLQEREDGKHNYRLAIQKTPPGDDIFDGVLDTLRMMQDAHIVDLREVITMIEEAWQARGV